MRLSLLDSHRTNVGAAVKPRGLTLLGLQYHFPDGRGLFTTQAVKAGDLLFCEKAFAHAFHDENGSKGG
jgi:hypothetical protein